MIQKRYEYFSKDGKHFTSWFDFEDDDSQLSRLQTEEKWQAKKLLNEYRIV